MEQEQRTNAGYAITDSVHVGDAEFVLGEKETKFGTMCVTWQCRDGDNYFWGHYFDDRGAAEEDLQERVAREREYQALRKETAKKAQRSREQEAR